MIAILAVCGIIVFVIISTKPCPDGQTRQKIGDCYTCATICPKKYGIQTQHYPIEGKKCEHTECLLCPPGQTYQTTIPGDYSTQGQCVEDCPENTTRCVPELNYQNITNIPGLNNELNLTDPGDGISCTNEPNNCIFSGGISQSCIDKENVCGPIKFNKGSDEGKETGISSQCCGEGKYQKFPKCDKNNYDSKTNYLPPINNLQFPTIYTVGGNKCDLTKDLSGNLIKYNFPPEPLENQNNNFCINDPNNPSPSGWCWNGNKSEKCDSSNILNETRTNYGWCEGCPTGQTPCRLKGSIVCCPSDKCVSDRGSGTECCTSPGSEVIPEYIDDKVTNKMVCCPKESIVTINKLSEQSPYYINDPDLSSSTPNKACCPLNAPIAKDGKCYFKCGDNLCLNDSTNPMACIEINGKKSCISSKCTEYVSNPCPSGTPSSECPSEFKPNSGNFKPKGEFTGHCFDFTKMSITPEIQLQTQGQALKTYDICRSVSSDYDNKDFKKPFVYCGDNLGGDYVRDFSMDITATPDLIKDINSNSQSSVTVQDYLQQSCLQFGLNTPAGSGQGGQTTYTATSPISGNCSVEMPCDVNSPCESNQLETQVKTWYNTNKQAINVNASSTEPTDYTPYLDINGKTNPSILKVNNGTGYTCGLDGDFKNWNAVSSDNNYCLPLMDTSLYNKIKSGTASPSYSSCQNTIKSNSQSNGGTFNFDPYLIVDKDEKSFNCTTNSCTKLLNLGGTAHCKKEPCIGNLDCTGCQYGQYYDNNSGGCLDCEKGKYNPNLNPNTPKGFAKFATCQTCGNTSQEKGGPYVANYNNDSVCLNCPSTDTVKPNCTATTTDVSDCCNVPQPCVAGQTWSSTGYEPCNKCTQCNGKFEAVGKACTKTSDTTCIDHCQGNSRYDGCDAGNGGHTGSAGNCGSGWATNGTCASKPGDCKNNFLPGCLEGSGVVLDKCPGDKCGVSDAEQDSIWAGEGTKCMDKGYSCGGNLGSTCISNGNNSVWIKNCPPGWSCGSSDIHRGNKCWDNGLKQIMTCEQCGGGWPCVSKGEWVWGGPGDNYCTGGGCENVKSNAGPCK